MRVPFNPFVWLFDSVCVYTVDCFIFSAIPFGFRLISIMILYYSNKQSKEAQKKMQKFIVWKVAWRSVKVPILSHSFHFLFSILFYSILYYSIKDIKALFLFIANPFCTGVPWLFTIENARSCPPCFVDTNRIASWFRSGNSP